MIITRLDLPQVPEHLIAEAYDCLDRQRIDFESFYGGDDDHTRWSYSWARTSPVLFEWLQNNVAQRREWVVNDTTGSGSRHQDWYHHHSKLIYIMDLGSDDPVYTTWYDEHGHEIIRHVLAAHTWYELTVHVMHGHSALQQGRRRCIISQGDEHPQQRNHNDTRNIGPDVHQGKPQ